MTIVLLLGLGLINFSCAGFSKAELMVT